MQMIVLVNVSPRVRRKFLFIEVNCVESHLERLPMSVLGRGADGGARRRIFGVAALVREASERFDVVERGGEVNVFGGRKMKTFEIFENIANLVFVEIRTNIVIFFIFAFIST